MRARDKEGALLELAELAAAHPAASGTNVREVYRLLLEREQQGSTGFGNEIAIPHARISGLSGFIVITGVSHRGVSFDSLDKKKVKVFLLILGPPEQVNVHLRTLATLSRALAHTSLKKELLAARSTETAVESILRHTGAVRHAPGASKASGKKMAIINVYMQEYLQNILELMVEMGIDGATILESGGMGAHISDVPIFASFIGFMQERKNISKTIIALVEEEQSAELIRRIEELTGDLDTHQGAMIMLIDVATVRGSMKMM